MAQMSLSLRSSLTMSEAAVLAKPHRPEEASKQEAENAVDTGSIAAVRSWKERATQHAKNTAFSNWQQPPHTGT